jgi:hypothetical protein
VARRARARARGCQHATLISTYSARLTALALGPPRIGPERLLDRILDGLELARHLAARYTAPHTVGQHAPRVAQHLLSKCRTVLAIDIAHQQCIDSNDERSGRQRHGELRSVSGGIARDRSTTAQRSSQVSKTAAGRKHSPWRAHRP